MASHRRPRALLIVAVAAATAIVLVALAAAATIALIAPVRGEVSGPPGSSDAPAATSEPEPAVPAAPVATRTIAEEAAAVAGAIDASTATWRRSVTDVSVTTWLRRPLIVVSTSIGPEQADLAEELVDGIVGSRSIHTATDGTALTYFFQVRSSEGDVIGSAGSTDARWRLTGTPPTPADPDRLAAWLAAVYGPSSPGPEPWHGHIRDVSASIADPDGYLVIRTDLDPARVDDGRTAETIIAAVNSSGATFAPAVRVLFADGAYEWTGMLDGADPYATP